MIEEMNIHRIVKVETKPIHLTSCEALEILVTDVDGRKFCLNLFFN
jgi:hypothetical protein